MLIDLRERQQCHVSHAPRSVVVLGFRLTLLADSLIEQHLQQTDVVLVFAYELARVRRMLYVLIETCVGHIAKNVVRRGFIAEKNGPLDTRLIGADEDGGEAFAQQSD